MYSEFHITITLLCGKLLSFYQVVDIYIIYLNFEKGAFTVKYQCQRYFLNVKVSHAIAYIRDIYFVLLILILNTL